MAVTADNINLSKSAKSSLGDFRPNGCSKVSSFTLVVKEGVGLIVFKLSYSNWSCLKSGLSQLDKIILVLNNTQIAIAWPIAIVAY